VNDPLSELAARQHGVISLDQADLVGLRSADVSNRIGSERWERVGRRTARITGSPPGRGQTVMTLDLEAGRGAVLSHTSAAAWWRVSGPPLLPVHVTRMPRSRLGMPAATVLHTVRSLPTPWTTVLDGVPVARPELVALQLFAICRPERAERWVDRMWSMRLLDGRSIQRLLEDVGLRGRNGTAGLRAYLRPRGLGYVPPASGLESRVDQILRGAGISMARQVDVGGETAWTGRGDFADIARVRPPSNGHAAGVWPDDPRAVLPQRSRGPGQGQPQDGQTIDWSSEYAWRPKFPPSRPTPDCLNPPKGASWFRCNVLIPTLPERSCFATSQARPASWENT
jgi:hypothetical protein